MVTNRSVDGPTSTVRDSAVGCWWRPDACAAGSATPSDGAPTLVLSDGAIGRANSQPPVSQASSLSHPHAPPCHIYMHTYTQDTRVHTNAYTHVDTATRAHSLTLSPPTSCEGLHPPNDTRGSPSSWLVPHGCSAFPNTHETTSNYLHARTHAHGAEETRGGSRRFLRLLARSAEKSTSRPPGHVRHAAVCR